MNIDDVSDAEWNNDPYVKALFSLTVAPYQAVTQGVKSIFASWDPRFDLKT